MVKIWRLLPMKRLVLLLSLTAICPILGMQPPLPAKAAAAQAPVEQVQIQEGTECSLCLEPIIGGQSYSKTPCEHMYHYKCFNDFSLSEVRYSCPNCRAQLTDATLALLQNAPSGTIKASAIPAPIMAQAPAPFLDRIKNVFSPSLPVIPVNEVTQELMRKRDELKQLKQANKALESHAEDLGDSKERLEENLRKEIARLVDKSRALERKMENQKTDFEQRLRKVKSQIPEHAHVLRLQDSITALGKEKDALAAHIKSLNIKLANATNSNESLRSLIRELEQIKEAHEKANKVLTQRYRELEQRQNYLERAALIHCAGHKALRKRLVTLSSLSIGALSGYLAYKYVPDYPKTAAFFAGATGLIGSYFGGSSYIHKCYLQDLRTIQN